MKFIGAHVSTAGGVQNAPLNAAKIGASAFALFTKNQRRWQASPLTGDCIEAFKRNCRELGFSNTRILVHDSYLINPGHPDKQALAASRRAFLDEFQRCEQLALKYLVFHPGNHLNKQNESACLDLVAQTLNFTLAATTDVTAVIENTAGQGTSVGHRFEHLAHIIDRVEDKTRVGICLDTCHLFAAGYDIKSKSGYERTMACFDRLVGIAYLKAMHLNDTKKSFRSRVDRHESIGKGKLGTRTFGYIMKDPRLDNIPLILETPDRGLWPKEIVLLKSMAA